MRRGRIEIPAGRPTGTGTAHPRYTPDGRWFWTGAAWVPGREVLRGGSPPPPPSPPIATPRPRGPVATRQVLVAVILALVLLAARAAPALLTRSPGVEEVAPVADTVFAMPFTDRVRSADLQGWLIDGSGTITLQGEIDFTPERALHVTRSLGGAYVGECLDAGGVDYQTQQRGGPWQAVTPVSPVDQYLGWAGGPPPPHLRVLGRETVDGQAAWHLRSRSGGDWWIAAATGRPLRYAYRSRQLEMALTFGHFGDASAIATPPASNVTTAPIGGALGTIIVAPEASLGVLAVQVSPAGSGPPPRGVRYQAVYVRYENDDPDPITFENAFTLTATDGSQYTQTGTVEVSPVLPRTRVLQPGERVSGWDVFVVARGAAPLTLRAGPPLDEQKVDFLVSVPLG
ncbi:MAG: DUF4352 domain-containing protein [Candidatus Dormibacteraceae bacterium]